MTLLIIPYMAWLSRMAGGGWPKLPYGLDAWLLCAPFLLFTPVMGWWAIPAYLSAVLGVRLGHGRGFNYNIPFKEGSEPEKIEVLIPKGLPVWEHKAMIMLLTGLAVTIVPSMVLGFHGHIWAQTVLLLAGMAKCACYLLPHTEWAEWARGGCLGVGVVVGFECLV